MPARWGAGPGGNRRSLGNPIHTRQTQDKTGGTRPTQLSLLFDQDYVTDSRALFCPAMETQLFNWEGQVGPGTRFGWEGGDRAGYNFNPNPIDSPDGGRENHRRVADFPQEAILTVDLVEAVDLERVAHLRSGPTWNLMYIDGSARVGEEGGRVYRMLQEQQTVGNWGQMERTLLVLNGKGDEVP